MKKISHNVQVRSLQIFNHVLAIVGIAFALIDQQYQYLLISLLAYWFTGVVGINVGMHRLLSHRSFKTYPIIEKIVSVVSVLTTVGSPLAWVALHRQHHRACERDGDPHSPYLLGPFKAWFGFWDYSKMELKLIRDLRKDSFQKLIHKNYMLIIASFCAVLAFIDPWLVIYAYAIPACLCLHSSSSIIVIAHMHGYKTYDLGPDQSRNSWIANILTLGEGWHNNHHAKPYAWSNWEKWWEWDLPAVVIWMIKRR